MRQQVGCSGSWHGRGNPGHDGCRAGKVRSCGRTLTLNADLSYRLIVAEAVRTADPTKSRACNALGKRVDALGRKSQKYGVEFDLHVTPLVSAAVRAVRLEPCGGGVSIVLPSSFPLRNDNDNDTKPNNDPGPDDATPAKGIRAVTARA